MQLDRYQFLLSSTVVLCALALADRAEAQKRNRDVITRQEIVDSPQFEFDLYQAVRSLRPHFLAGPRGVRTLGASPPAPTALYVNGNRMGEIDGLKLILARNADEVRYLDPSRAENQFGLGHSGGAILVKLIAADLKEVKPDTAGAKAAKAAKAVRR